jgi:hypothetical protein
MAPAQACAGFTMNKPPVASKTRKQLRNDLKKNLSDLKPTKDGNATSRPDNSREDRDTAK